MRKVIILPLTVLLLLSSCGIKHPDNSLPDESPPSSQAVTPQEPFVPIPAPSLGSASPTTPLAPSPERASPSPEPTPSTPEYAEPTLSDLEFWVRVDGSTVTIPMSYALYEHFIENRNWQAGEVIYHNKTHAAYQNLLDEKKDIIFVTEPSAEAQRLFDEAGVDIDVIPIAKDAFVLFVNSNNPVKSLTQQQLRDIYTGDITNWKDIGGEDIEIIPYQRGETSGSQTLFLSLLMRDTEPMLAPSEYYYADMGGIIDAVSEYINGDAAIGFSLFYYASYMYGNDNIRFLEVDGVLPTEESIIAGEYPLENYYYAVLRRNTPADHPARQLLSYILSDEGQELMRQNGYVPLRELAVPYDEVGGTPQYYGTGPDDHLEGIGAELYDPLRPIDIYGIPRKLDSGLYYSHPSTSSEKVNALLNTFIEDTINKADFKERTAENLHVYGVPFSQHTLKWRNFLTCVVYLGEISPFSPFYLYDFVADTFEVYASICIDTEKGEIIDPDIIIDALLMLEYMDGAKTVYERAADYWLSPKPDHIPSDEHIVTALWINSEQAIVIEIADQGNTYLYGICTNDSGGYAGP